ncbi:MAG: cytochrome c, partial [Pseudomonadota bacterium]
IEREPAELVAGVPYDPNHVGDGAALYVSSCLFCHGVPGVNNGGNIPNLGYSQKATIENLGDFVLTNALIEGGMPNFEGKLSKDDISKLVAFIQGTADAVRPK